MSNYPDGFNTRLLIEDELPDHIQDDLGRIHAAHDEIMDAIREMLKQNFPIANHDVLEFLQGVDEAFGEMVHSFCAQIEAKTGIRIERPITLEYANWLREKNKERLRPVKQNPQTHIDVAVANALAALSMFDSADRSA